jgi:aspartate/methionine/tyrosine aminotransferase
MVTPVTTLVINSYSCVATFVQWAGIEALQGSQDDVNAMRESFRQRRDLIVEGLNAIPGVECEMPPGAFYVFPNVRSFGRSSKEIADILLQEAGVATLAGTDFGSQGEGHLRLSYANSESNIEKALRWIADSLGRL